MQINEKIAEKILTIIKVLCNKRPNGQVPAVSNSSEINDEKQKNGIDIDELLHDCLNAGGEVPSSTRMCIF